MSEMQSCRSDEGKIVGLVDACIGIHWFLAESDLSLPDVQEALADMFMDPDFLKIQEAGLRAVRMVEAREGLTS
jgi:hypothetical protein